jgi:hypothetical protein
MGLWVISWQPVEVGSEKVVTVGKEMNYYGET